MKMEKGHSCPFLCKYELRLVGLSSAAETTDRFTGRDSGAEMPLLRSRLMERILFQFCFHLGHAPALFSESG